MIVLALAGHVDHGKTALVRALTGVDTDRLVEEKTRGMTTDLGFASLDLGVGPSAPGVPARRRKLAVVDVPGHERYVRNMAAGAWGAGLCLLCVAADDGWMAQTENHVRLLAAFGSPRIVLALTKSDLVSAARVAEVEADCLARLGRLFGPDGVPLRGHPVRAGARRGAEEGLAELRSALAAAFDGMELTESAGSGSRDLKECCSAYLFVDRSFVLAGAGPVACGLLRGAALEPGGRALVLPRGEEVRIKGLECLGERAARAEEGSRVAVNVSKPKDGIARGDVLWTGNGAAPPVAFEFLAKIEAVPRSDGSRGKPERVLEKGGEAELVVGSAWRSVRVVPLASAAGFFRLSMDEKLCFPFDLRGALVRPGGAELLGRVVPLRAGASGRADRRRLAACLTAFRDAPASLLRAAAAASDGREAVLGPSEAAALPPPEAIREVGLDLESRETEAGVLRAFLVPRARAGTGRQVPSASAAAEPPRLHPAASALADALLRAGTAGLDLGTPAKDERGRPVPPPPRAALSELCAAGIAVPLDRDLFWHRDVYRDAAAAALRGLASGDRFSVPEAKSRTGLSRKWALPFLNRLERDGFVRREGDERVVIRLP